MVFVFPPERPLLVMEDNRFFCQSTFGIRSTKIYTQHGVLLHYHPSSTESSVFHTTIGYGERRHIIKMSIYA